MITLREPMLAHALMPSGIKHTDENILSQMKKLRYPVLATVKMDGIRALRLNGSLLSRKFLPIPNRKIRERSLILAGGMDVELWNPSLAFNEIASIVMSTEHDDWDKIQFYVLDWVTDGTYQVRLIKAGNWFLQNFTQDSLSYIRIKQYPTVCTDATELMSFFLHVESEQGEGICFRTLNSPYKSGRSTLKEQYLIKLSRYHYEEATITSVFEQVENTNYAGTSKTGHTKRSSCQEGMVGKGTMGGFVVTTITNSTVVRVGTGEGWTDSFRRKVWNNPMAWIGKQITIKSKPTGKLNKPRHPIMVGERKEGY